MSISFSYKFLMLGDSQVGKTSLIERYTNNTFSSDYITTIGMDKRFKRLEINNVDVDISITDTAGQERFRSLSKMYYKGADGIFIGFSLTEPSSLANINFWIEQINQNCSKDYPISLVLFGNKCDDKGNIKVKPEDIEKVRQQYGLKYFETSAKENINVKEVFEYLTKETICKKGHLEKYGLTKKNASIDNLNIKVKENQKFERKKKPLPAKKKKKCC